MTSTVTEWRQPKPGRKVFKNSMIITDCDPINQIIYYHMAYDIDSQHEYRIPKDNLPFILEAIVEKKLVLDKPYNITIESDGRKSCRWIKIDSI